MPSRVNASHLDTRRSKLSPRGLPAGPLVYWMAWRLDLVSDRTSARDALFALERTESAGGQQALGRQSLIE